MIGMQGMLVGGLAIAALAAFGGSHLQKGIDERACERKVEKLRTASIAALNVVLQDKLTAEAERDQALGEVRKVNATTAAQFLALQTMLQDDQVKREEASIRVEAAAKEAARNAKTAGDRAQAARDLMVKIQDQCAGTDVPAELLRMLDGIADPATPKTAMDNR